MSVYDYVLSCSAKCEFNIKKIGKYSKSDESCSLISALATLNMCKSKYVDAQERFARLYIMHISFTHSAQCWAFTREVLLC